MKTFLRRIKLLCSITLPLLNTGCSARAPLNAQAQPGRPAAAVVEEVSYPYDPSKPRFAIIVEPMQAPLGYSNITLINGGIFPAWDQLSAQLTTTLSRVGNFTLYDSQRTYQPSDFRGLRGPYTLRATLTEYNENSESETESSSVSLGWIGILAGIAGAITGESGLLWSGFGLAAINPSYEETSMSKVGMVAMDIQIVDRSSGQIISSFSAAGRYKTQQQESSVSVFGIGSSGERSVASAIGQAQRIALHEVAQKTLGALAD